MFRRIATSLLLALCGFGGVFGVPAALELLRRAETFEGVVFAIAALLFVPAFGASVLAIRFAGTPRAKKPLRAAIATGIPVLIGFVVLESLAPDDDAIGSNYGEGAVRPIYLDGVEQRTFSLAQLLPEIDQVALGITAAGLLDPHFDGARTERLRAMTMPIYLEMREDPAYNNLESAMSFAYADVWGGNQIAEGAGHAFEVVPASGPGEKLPVLLFLHGSVGNFQSYVHVLRALANSARMIVVCPTNGFGDWSRPDAAAIVERMLRHIRDELPADTTHIYLGGLSAGGFGATHAVAALPGKFRGVILLSPVFDEDAVSDSAWKELPVFIAHGVEDERVPNDYVSLNRARLEVSGAKITDHRYPGEDHFVFYAKRTEILGELAAWIEKNR